MTASRPRGSLRSDFAWVLSGNVLYSACQWGIVVALAKLGSPEQVGEYAFGLAVSAPVVLFANLQLRALLASDVTGQFRFGRFLAFRLVSLAAALLLVAGAAAFLHAGWRRGEIMVLVGFAQALEFVSETYYGFMQQHGRMDRMSTSLILKGPLALTALCAAMYVTRSVVWAVLGLILGRLIVILLWDSRLGFAKPDVSEDSLRLEWRAAEMSTLLRLAFPLGIISMLVSLNSSIPRYFVEAHSGTAELGIFSAIASLQSAGALVVAALGQSIFVPVAQAWAARDRAKYRSYVWLAAALGGALGGVAILLSALFGRTVLTYLFRPEYAERADILVWLMVAATVTFIGSGLGYVITAARSLRPQIPLQIATALAAAGVSAWLVPKYGLSGATAAAMAAAVVQLAGTAVIVMMIDRRLESVSPSMGSSVGSARAATGELEVEHI